MKLIQNRIQGLIFKSYNKFSQHNSIRKIQFQNKPAKIYSYYQQSTQPHVKDNLVVFHGLFGSHTNFRTILKHPSISDQVHTYSLDLRNHGMSEHKSTMSLQEMGEDILNFLQENDLRNTILMGHSMGGRAIMSALQHYSQPLEQFVKGVIICDISPGNLITARSADVMEMWVMINSLLQINFEGKSKIDIDKEVRKIIPNPQVAGFMMMNVIQDEQHPGRYKWRINLQAIRDYYKENLATEIKDANWNGPCSIICGSKSHYVNQSKIQEFQSIFKTMEYDRDVHFIRGAGHWLHADKPAEFTEKVSSFIQRIK